VSEHVRLDVAPDGTFVAVTTTDGSVRILPLDGSPPTELRGLEAQPTALAVSSDSRLVAAAGGGLLAPSGAVIRAWDLTSGEARVVDRELPGPVWDLRFTIDGGLLASDGDGALRRYDLAEGTHEVIAARFSKFDATPEGKRLVVLSEFDPTGGAPAAVLDVATSTITDIAKDLDEGLFAVAIDRGGEVVVGGCKHGIVCVTGRSGEEPHLLYGHQGVVTSVAISANGRWIASGSQDATVRLWRAPIGTPVQALPLRRFLEVMYQNCNYAYVKNPDAPTGFDTVIRPFAGWEDFPEY
jgi:WD40 repeat protein